MSPVLSVISIVILSKVIIGKVIISIVILSKVLVGKVIISIAIVSSNIRLTLPVKFAKEKRSSLVLAVVGDEEEKLFDVDTGFLA
jgi:hypothetical protein